MFRLVAAGAMFMLCLVGSPAAAEPFDDFVNLCMNNDGRRDLVIAKAEERGWYRLPTEVVPPDNAELKDMVAFLSADPADHPDGMPAGLRMLMVGRGDGQKLLGVASLELEVCAVAVMDDTAPTASWADRLDQTLGLKAITKTGAPLWVFSRDGTKFRSEADALDLPEDQIATFAKQQSLYLASVLDEDYPGLLFAAVRSAD